MDSFKDWCLNNGHSELLDEWHKTKNIGISPDLITIGSGKKIWWVKHYDDPKTGKHFDFEWCSTINDRLRYSCPYLSKPAKKVFPGFNDLFSDFPSLKSEWDYEKNSIDPLQVTSGSGKKVFWRCSNNHSYEMRISHRTNGHGCPYCIDQKRIDLVASNPDFLKEWD